MEAWHDIGEMIFSQKSIAQKYRYLYDSLHRVCIDITAKMPTEYSDFFSRLQAVCRVTNYPLYRIDTFRWRARRVSHDDMPVDEHTFMCDVRVFADAYAHFTNTKIPSEILVKLPQGLDSVPVSLQQVEWAHRQKRMRFTAVSIDEPFVMCVSKDVPSEDLFRVDIRSNSHTMKAGMMLQPGMQFNALSYTVDADGVFHPLYIIVEPDFLLDITSITGCLKPYGDSAFNHFIDKLKPNKSTVHTLLGDFANQFLDDAFNLADPEYAKSMQKTFNDKIIDICACEDIDDEFFSTTRQQFQNILKTVAEISELPATKDKVKNINLEPSFFCEAMGIQGRMDCLIEMEDDKYFLIELKSGKWDEYRNRAKMEHLMQMLLYKEILYYNMGVRQSEVIGNLLYSKYPKLQEQRSFQDVVFQAMDIRNSIVCMERGLVDGKGKEWVPRITPNALRRDASCSDKFWSVWCLPELSAVTNALHSMDELTAEYFYTFLQFIEREQYESKVCDSRPDSTRAMSALWNADINTKIENGDIFLNLSITDLRMSDGVEAVCLQKRQEESDDVLALPNFRIGDSVVLYKRNKDEDNAVSQQVVRCNVENYDDDSIWLRLKFPQRNVDVFDKKSLYAIEHDHIEASARSLYSGLFSLVTAEKERRELILCQREPVADKSQQLTKHYLNEQIDSIVLKAKMAKDLFLLMGPPGTGKTSVALKSMVEEMLASGENILLLSYTNRAVDEICEMLSTIDGQPDYIRLGRELSCAPQHQSHLVVNTLGKLKKRSEVRDMIARTRIFVSTVASMNGHMSLLEMKKFGVAIFDEASQILEPQILGLLTHPSIGKFIMIGDHKQLPAVVVQNEEKSSVASPMLNGIGLTNCRNSLFERLYEQNKDNSDVIAMLDHQGRMHPQICNFASILFYDGKLLPVGLPHQKEELCYAVYDSANELERLVATSRFAFIDVPRPSVEIRQTKANILEAKKIALLVKVLAELQHKNGQEFDCARHIGIIVPFRRQIAMVRNELCKMAKSSDSVIAQQMLKSLPFMVIDTVERYQGSQRDIIIYGTTISQRYELDILSNISSTASGDVDRKLNVAITRARKQLFVLGNKELLMQNKIYAEMIKGL